MAAGLFIVRVTLKSGYLQELGYEDSDRASEALQRINAAAFAALPGAIAVVVHETDDFGRLFAVPAERVDCCVAADFAAELMMGLKVESMRAVVKQQFTEMQQRRAAGAGRLIVPAGPVPPGGPHVNGGFRAG